jgi:hypothetical protein
MSWKLIRHKKDRQKGGPAAIYWARETSATMTTHGSKLWEPAIEIRAPINAAGNGSEEPGELLSPEASAKSGLFPRSAVKEFYVETSPEELGLEVIG